MASAMDLQSIRDFVRVSLDVDVEELPDAILDVFVGEGFNRAINLSAMWNFYGVDYTLTTTTGVSDYNFGDESAVTRHTAFTYPLRRITDVRGDNWTLTPVDHATIRANMRTTSPSSGNPWAWSEHGNSLTIWPVPDAAVDLQVSGFRAPIDWVSLGAGAYPDAPDDFHVVIAFHALSRSWAQQSDPEMAKYYSEMFMADMGRLKIRYATPISGGPFVMNGGLGVDILTRNGLGPLVYPFE